MRTTVIILELKPGDNRNRRNPKRTNERWLRSGSSRVSLPEKLKVAKDRQHLLPDVVWQHAPGVDDQLQVRVVHAMCMLAALRSAPGPPQIPGDAITRFLK